MGSYMLAYAETTFDMDFWGINFGYDRKVKMNWNSDVYAGAFFGYSRGTTDYSNGGSGTTESQMAGLYASSVAPNGFYAGSVLKYRWRRSEFDTYSGGDYVTSDKIHTGGFGWSLELGQRISFSGERRTGWYVEPQVQIRHQHHDDEYYNLSDGLRIGTEGFTSIIGRVSMLIGYEAPERNFYAKNFRAHEFEGDLNVYGNGERIGRSTGGSWWIYGIGYTTKLNDMNSIYLDLERTEGADFEQKWRLNLGFRRKNTIAQKNSPSQACCQGVLRKIRILGIEVNLIPRILYRVRFICRTYQNNIPHCTK